MDDRKRVKTLFDPRQDVLRFGAPKKQVFCPLCPLDITALSISERNGHAEQCLGLVDSDGDVTMEDITRDDISTSSGTPKEELTFSATPPSVKAEKPGLGVPIFLADEFLHLLDRGVKKEEMKVHEELKFKETKELKFKETKEVKEEPDEVYFSADEVAEVTPPPATKKRRAPARKAKQPCQSTMTTNDQGDMISATPEPVKKQKRAKKPAPDFKTIKMGKTNVAVDSFMHGPLEGISLYFLSHFHADHYGGLRKSWNHGPIFCTPITAALCKMKLGVLDEWLVPIPTHIPFCVGNDVEVTFFDANHCPGAAVILFTSPTKTAVHCGDFRANMNLVRELKLKLKQRVLDELYLDTTYLGPSHAFPSQNRVIQVCGDFCLRLNNMKMEQLEKAQRQATIGRFFSSPGSPAPQLRTLFVVGTYTIGKERLAVEIAQRLGAKMFAEPTKRRILQTFNDPVISNLLTSDPLQAQVHLVPLGKTRKDQLFEYLQTYKPHFSKIVAFAPTGWSYRPPRSAIEANERATDLQQSYFDFGDLEYKVENLDRNLERSAIEPVQKYNVPYSEHSSFIELRAFCLNMAATEIIPTVNMSSDDSVRKQMYWLDMWTKQAGQTVVG
ncbi:DNA cross-link repair protein PSO2/SNM1 [Yarrowia sp. C11]|nr:DNA cross-link repair protein PSO2/SNM1 [Yarrowia sp. E02]KAG5369463.1 DNA cross-link repair protein PSO2/SNM1 [Yarrowia sp. C11]